MGRYDALADWLRRSGGSRRDCTFAEIDRVVGGLPPTARTDRTRWGKTTSRTRVQATAWLGAGWRVDHVDLASERVVFTRSGPGREEERPWRR